MIAENKFKSALAFAAIMAFISACSSGPAVQEYADTADAKNEVASFDGDMNGARNNQLDVLAPESFDDAQNSLNDAKSSLDKQKSSKDTLHHVAKGRAYLSRANAFAQVAHANIEQVIVARKDAVDAGAPGFFSWDFKKADHDLIEMTSDIEKNKLANATENKTELQLKYLDLELKSIKHARLGRARDTISLATKEGAKEFAPRSLAIAEKSVQDTDAFITANRHDTAQVNLRSAESTKKADHLIKITRNSKSGKKTSSEDMALQMEGEQNKVADKQGELTEKQNQLDSKQDQLDSKQSQLNSGVLANQALMAANLNLESEQAFNRQYEEARAEFTESEAEVYKQGNVLMIRLRGLEFPVAQAVLKGSNFPLLAKVQKVIRNFGKSHVIVEGHTDSNGGKVLNNKLSSDRASAVKQYLVSNSEDANISITAIGYGYQKPLATNKTADGRAQNRRVDVLIEPEKSQNM